MWLTLRKTSGDEGCPSSLGSLQERGEWLVCDDDDIVPFTTAGLPVLNVNEVFSLNPLPPSLLTLFH